MVAGVKVYLTFFYLSTTSQGTGQMVGINTGYETSSGSLCGMSFRSSQTAIANGSHPKAKMNATSTQSGHFGL